MTEAIEQLAHLRAEAARMRLVYQAAIAWRKAVFRPNVEHTTSLLEQAIDAAERGR